MGGYILKKTRAKYIGPDDVEYKNGKEYMIYPIKDVPDGSLIAAENAYGEAYAMPAKLFEIIND